MTFRTAVEPSHIENITLEAVDPFPIGNNQQALQSR